MKRVLYKFGIIIIHKTTNIKAHTYTDSQINKLTDNSSVNTQTNNYKLIIVINIKSYNLHT